jgi:hypothetical protein
MKFAADGLYRDWHAQLLDETMMYGCLLWLADVLRTARQAERRKPQLCWN